MSSVTYYSIVNQEVHTEPDDFVGISAFSAYLHAFTGFIAQDHHKPKDYPLKLHKVLNPAPDLNNWHQQAKITKSVKLSAKTNCILMII